MATPGPGTLTSRSGSSDLRPLGSSTARRLDAAASAASPTLTTPSVAFLGGVADDDDDDDVSLHDLKAPDVASMPLTSTSRMEEAMDFSDHTQLASLQREVER
ncbi:hypothetical protein EON68_04280 [archaeon]|nr:MAG: hypothetical protein EON68_04280 [archaeon]